MSELSLVEQLKDLSYNLLSLFQGCFCQTDTTLKLNGRSFKIKKVLGEGGFSYVYLAEDLESNRLFALKKIRCPLGSDSVKSALKEVEAYKRFKHPNIIRILDSCVVQDSENLDSKIIYLFLPYYKQSVQDIIAIHSVNGTLYPEKSMLNVFLGTCNAVKAMHSYVSGPAAPKEASHYPPSPSTSSHPSKLHTEEEDADEEEGIRGVTGEGEQEALINKMKDGGVGNLVESLENGGDISTTEASSSKKNVSTTSGKKIEDGTPLPWAHRDIKPANIMIADDSSPILMDFGSALPARIEIPTRSIALEQQDLAAECCSMPFRAPELFDVMTNTTLTEAVDIWSLGCTLYAMAYHTSPFETIQQSEHGGSIAMAVLGGKFSFPTTGTSSGFYSEGLKELIKGMLVVKPEGRPKIDEVIKQTKNLLATL